MPQANQKNGVKVQFHDRDGEKPKRDDGGWLKESSSENFQAYLPQSLSDNILVSHKSQALQHHSKRQG